MNKITVFVLYAVLTLAVGLWIHARSEATPVVDTTIQETKQLSLNASASATEALLQEKRLLEQQNEALRSEVAALTEQLGALEEETRPDPPAVQSTLPATPLAAVVFGEYGELAEVLNADWDAMGRSALTMTDDLALLVAGFLAGSEQVDPELQRRIAKMNQALITYVLDVGAKIHSYAPGNGAFTHPISQTNLIAQALQHAEQPLSDYQLQTLATLGEQFEADWQQVESEYTNEVPRLQKILDELELKRDFTAGVRDTLSDAQLEVMYRPETSDLSGKDLFSPALLLGSIGWPVGVESKQQLKDVFRQQMVRKLQVEEKALAAHEDVFDRWVENAAGHLEAVPAAMTTSFTIDDGVVAARAQLRAMLELAERLGLDAEQRKPILEQDGFLMPRLLQTEEPHG